MSLASCIQVSDDGIPDSFTDTSGLTIQFDNFGVVRVSFIVLHKSDSISGGDIEFTINSRNFIGTIDNIVPSELEGTDYKESRITFIGFAC